jgi:hypothetical protein
MWSHSLQCLDHRNKIPIYTFALISIGFCFSLSSFPSWALDHHHMWPSSSFHVINITIWVPPCSLLRLHQLSSYRNSWQRLVHRFHQLSKIKLGLSPMLRVFHLNIAKVDRGVTHVAMGHTCRIRLLQLLRAPPWVIDSSCGRLRPADASAMRHPLAGHVSVIHGFLHTSAVVRRKRVHVVGCVKTDNAGFFPVRCGLPANDRKRSIFWAAPDVRSLVTPIKLLIASVSLFKEVGKLCTFVNDH